MSDKPNAKLAKLVNMSEKVKVCRDFFQGAYSVFDKEYLPVWSGESEAEYAVRIASTAFPNMYAPIVTGLTGLITKKEPIADGFDAFDLKDVDGKGSSLLGFVKQVCESSIVSGIEFVSAESDTEENSVFFKRYQQEQLMSYAEKDNKITQIVFRETIEEKDGDFGIKHTERYIVFKIGGGEVWFDNDDNKGLVMQDDWENELKEIPIVAIQTGKELSTFEIIPRMYDIAMLNKVTLNLESQLANVLAIVGNPVALFYGELNDKKKMSIGVKDALVFDDKSKEGLEYAEIQGNGVTKIQEKIVTVGKDIDKMSFSLLEKSSNNTIIDAQEEQSKGTSFLTDVAIELEAKFNKLFEYAAELSEKQLSEDAWIEFKKDFDDVLFSDNQLKLLNEMLNAGNLSLPTFWKKLQVANILPKDFDSDNELELIERDPT